MSDQTSGNKRGCNRRSCPYYQRTVTHRHIGTTPYASANEGTSTQFLYFGPNFVGSPSGEIREFQDCLSDTEVPIVAVPSLARSLHQAASMLQRTDSANYEMMLRQIISISNRLLQHMNKHDPRQMRRDMTGDMGGTPPAIGAMGGTSPQIGGMGGMPPTIGGMGGTSPSYGRVGGTSPTFGRMGGTSPTGGIGGTSPTYGGMGRMPAYGERGATSPYGGTPAIGGTSAYGGTPAIGGTSTYGDTQAIAGTSPYGGTPAMGPTSAYGGTPAIGGTSAYGGTPAIGGTSAMGITDDAMAETAASGLTNRAVGKPPIGGTTGGDTSGMGASTAFGGMGGQAGTFRKDQAPGMGGMGTMSQYPSAVPSRTGAFEQPGPNVGMISRIGDISRDNVGATGANVGALSPLSAVGAMPVQHIPIDLRMLRIEPVNLNIPFTLHFQTTLPPLGADDQRPYILPSVSIEPIRTATIAPPPKAYPPQQQYAPSQQFAPPQPYTGQQDFGAQHPFPAQPPFPPSQTYVPTQPTSTAQPTAPGQDQLHFPYTADEQANMFVSQGKFPPITGPTSSYGNLPSARPKEEPLPSQLSQEPIFMQQPWSYPQGDQKDMTQASDLAQVPSSAVSGVMEVDKAVQTEKPIKAHQNLAQLQPPPPPPPPPPPLELETEAEAEATEKYSQTDSHRDHSYIIPTAETEHLSSSPNEHFDQVKLYKTEFTVEDELTAITRTATNERWTGGMMEGSEEQNETTPPTSPTPQMQDRATSTRRTREEHDDYELEKAQRQAQLEELEREQAMYEKPPQPCDMTGTPLKIPDNISYPSQYGRSTTPTSPQQQLEQQQPLRPQMTTTCTGTSFTCFTTAYNPRPCDMHMNMPPSINIPLCCRCMSRKRKARSHKHHERSASSKESRLCLQSSRNRGLRKSSSLRVGDEDYYTAESDSEADANKANKLAPKKAPCPKKKKQTCTRSVSVMHVSPMSPEQCMMLKVMEQMMKILCRMDAAQRGLRAEPEDSSVKTLYQSSRTEGMGEESISMIPCSEWALGGEGEDEKSTVAPSALAAYEDECAEELPSPKSSRTRRVSLKTDDEILGQESGMMPYSTQDSSAHGDQRSSNIDDAGATAAASAGTCNLPILVITFDRETGMPCCCVHSGPMNGSCQSIPVFDIQPCGGARSSGTPQQPYSTDDKDAGEEHVRRSEQPCSEECYCDEETRFEVRIHDQVQIIQKGDYCEGSEGLVDITMERVECSTMQLECNAECRAVCEATQTEECMAQWAGKTGQEVVRLSTDMLEEIHEYREEYCEYAEEEEIGSCHSGRSQRRSKTKVRSSKTKSGGDVGAVACDCCHCRAERESKLRKSLTPTQSGEPACLNAEECKHQLKSIVDSIITDLECMEKVRKRMGSEQGYTDEIATKSPPQHARQSFPVTILEVCELGLSSLYVKWVIHDCFGIGGYEIYVDGYLTNRYYNARHEAAVVCDVDVTQPHKVCLMAKPKAEKALLGAGDLLDDDCRPPVTPATWSPSVFLYEPSPEMDYCKRFR